MTNSGDSLENICILYAKDTRVWLPDDEEVWVEGVVQDFSYPPKGVLSVRLLHDGGEVRTLDIGKASDLPPLKNPDILIGESDLTSLSYLHEPAVLYNLKYRFRSQKLIYTYCGIVLVAINPYYEVDLYGPVYSNLYRGQNVRALDPHIFGVAEEACTYLQSQNQNQSIIVSGESGAGKTVSAKYVMRYFAGAGCGSAVQTDVENRVLSSNPLMEAFGNAKTIRNDNSSRFGKFIQIEFADRMQMTGARMQTYLLEKSRVVFQAYDERNYHIFYQLCAAATSSSREFCELQGLGLDDASCFHYTGQGINTVVDTIDDVENFRETCKAFTSLGFLPEERYGVWEILSGILQLGNVKFLGRPEDEFCALDPASAKHVTAASNLWAVKRKDLEDWLMDRAIRTHDGIIRKPLNVVQAASGRDALAKRLYSDIFSWIVDRVNRSLRSIQTSKRFIGVLDIYGFETFDVNSFEQFCINYANEKLQQQFNQHVFKLEQEEYMREEIQWSFIDFYDNQPCIDLIEMKIGILDLLDEECRFPRGSDKSWLDKLTQHFGNSDDSAPCKHFVIPKISSGNSFIVLHFASDVIYDIDGFLEKNKDLISEDLIDVVRASKMPLLKEIIDCSDAATFGASGTKSIIERDSSIPRARPRNAVRNKAVPHQQSKNQQLNKRSVASKFRESLKALMEVLNATTPHYVRCIKPNDEKAPFDFDDKRAIQQLRACGVLETVRVSAAGYPSRSPYANFFERYRILIPTKQVNIRDLKLTSRRICDVALGDTNTYELGKTKIFFRTGQVAILERLRADRLRTAATTMQKTIRGWLTRLRYARMRAALLVIQRSLRAFMVWRRCHFLRMHRATIIIQSNYRMHRQRSRYQRTMYCIRLLQAHCRGHLTRNAFAEVKYQRSILIVQKYFRRWIARKEFLKERRAAVKLQSHIRRWIAVKRFRILKAEARSVEGVRKLNKGLENKIFTLQQRIDELTAERARLLAHINEMTAFVDQVQNERKTMEHNIEKGRHTITALEDQLLETKGILETVAEEREMLSVENAKLSEDKKEIEAEKTQLEEACEKDGLRSELLQFELEQKSEEVENLRENLDQTNGAYSALIEEYRRIEEESRDSLSQISTPQTISAASTPYSTRSPSVSPRPISPISEFSVSALLGLRERLTAVEREREKVSQRLEKSQTEKEVVLAREPEDIFYARRQSEELSVENAKLKKALRGLIAKGTPKKDDLKDAWHKLQDELDRRRDESVHLHALLARVTEQRNVKLDGELKNNYADLRMAYARQSQAIILLMQQLDDRDARIQELENALNDARSPRGEGKGGAGQNTLEAEYTDIDAVDPKIKRELEKLVFENVDLKNKLDRKNRQIKKLRKTVNNEKMQAVLPYDTSDLFDSEFTSGAEPSVDHIHSLIAYKEHEFLGMIECHKHDVPKLMEILVKELKPTVARNFEPLCLPAYIFFMGMRYCDHVNDEQRLLDIYYKGLMAIQSSAKKRESDLDACAMYLSISVKWMQLLRQYSGENEYKQQNTPKQNEHCLVNFAVKDMVDDLANYVSVAYKTFLGTAEKIIQRLIVPAILEHEEVNGMARSRNRRFSLFTPAPSQSMHAMSSLLEQFNHLYHVVSTQALDWPIIEQIFSQIIHWVAIHPINNVVVRKDCCNWSKGMEIKFNVNSIEDWCREHNFGSSVSGHLQTLREVSNLLILNKAKNADDAIQSICDAVPTLKTCQVIKILNMYSGDMAEERIPTTLVERVEAQLQMLRNEHESSTGESPLCSSDIFPLNVPFVASQVALEKLEVPENMNLRFLKKL